MRSADKPNDARGGASRANEALRARLEGRASERSHAPGQAGPDEQARTEQVVPATAPSHPAAKLKAALARPAGAGQPGGTVQKTRMGQGTGRVHPPAGKPPAVEAPRQAKTAVPSSKTTARATTRMPADPEINDGFSPVPAPPRRKTGEGPIRLTPNAASADFQHLPAASRERLEALIEGRLSLAGSEDAASQPPLEPTEAASLSASARFAASEPTRSAKAETGASGAPEDHSKGGAGRAEGRREPPRMPPTAPDGVAPVNAHTVRGASGAAPASPIGSNRIREPWRNGELLRNGELWAALSQGKSALMSTGVFSLVINLLMLTGPLFMLQVYDRVMTSGSIPTLVALLVLTLALYGVIGALEFIRSRVVVRLGLEFDARVGDRIFRAALRRSALGRGTSIPALRELDNLRQFMSGQGPIAILDAPWTPIYLIVIFSMHWMLGVTALAGALVLMVFAWASERAGRQPLLDAGREATAAIELAEIGQRNAEAITAMGMTDAVRARWQAVNRNALGWQMVAADRLGALTATTKSLRLAMQSIMLAVGAALALSGAISAGAIVAATVIFGRAIAPVEMALGQWRSLVKAGESFAKLADLLRHEPEKVRKTQLPRPSGVLDVQGLKIAAPGTQQLILANVTFSLRPGQMVAVVGPSASGKSTLSRALVGVWPPVAGTIRLDGATLDHWHPDDLGRHIGYLPQEIELFAGTVRDNIARYQADASDEDVIAAAKRAHAHELILALPDGYETDIGAFGTHLSAGQRQRIALARALYGDPALVVLDEPNANLDRAGDYALAAAIDGMRANGQAVVLVSHRMQAIAKADLLLVVEKGLQRAFGPRDEILRKLQAAAEAAQVHGQQEAG